MSAEDLRRHAHEVRHSNHGRWYREFRPSTSQDDIDDALWASFGNSRSFWIEKYDLLQTLRDVGFTLISEQYDAPDIATDPSLSKSLRAMHLRHVSCCGAQSQEDE